MFSAVMSATSDQMWSLYLEAPKGATVSSVEVEVFILWSSSPMSAYPTSKDSSQFLAMEWIEQEDLMNLTVQCFSYRNTKSAQ